MARHANAWAWLGGLTVLGVLHAMACALPELASVFVRPSAWLAAALLRVPMGPGAEPVLGPPDCPMQVVASCGGWDFFCLLAALLVGRALWAQDGAAIRRSGRVAAALPAAALVTVVTNAGRLAAVFAGGILVLPHLPPSAAAAFHTGLGLAAFLPALLLTWIVWDRRVCHA
jgi:exosortase/archaeosortase family protein